MRDVDAGRGIFHVVVGEDAAEGGEIKKAELLCGQDLRAFVKDLPRMFLVDLEMRAEYGSDAGIRCSRTACTLPGQMEYDFSARINFAGEGEDFHISSIVEIDTVLVSEEALRRHRSWANSQLAQRPERCP